ncbi:MAG: PepSY domain-containing protein [Herminiimonas sp.]|nr:PepSY domain-containing protein [Herminiimonas sp.]
MSKLLFALVLSVSTGTAMAGAKCPANPKSEWLTEADARARIETQGYKIKKFKIDGNCYEIYGHDKAGKKVEIYYDTKTLAVVKAEIEK